MIPRIFGLISLSALILIALFGCSTAPQTRQVLAVTPSGLSPQRELSEVPFFAQDEYQCGPAALATVLSYKDQQVLPEVLVSKVYVPQRQGSLQVEMLAASRALGRIPLKVEPSLRSALSWVDAGEPVLVLQNLGLDWFPRWHYAVVVGYDLSRGEILLRSGIVERYRVDMSVFERTWQRSQFWGFVTLRPGQLPLAQNEDRYFLAVAGFERQASIADQQRAWLTGLAEWPESVKLLMGYGNHLYSQGERLEAEQIYRRIIDLDTRYGPAYNNLAQLMIERGKPDEALAYLSRAIAYDPKHKSIYQQTLNKARALQRKSGN